MPPRTIPFPPVHMALRQGGLELSLLISVTLELPDSLSDIQSYLDLVNAAQDQHLWIARHRSSYFIVSLTKRTSILSALERIMVAEWIESHEIWNRLGLKMVRPSTDDDPAKISWSIQHPDLTSVLAAPEQALTAEFREVTCGMELKQSSREHQATKGSKRRKLKQEEVESPRGSTLEIGSLNDGYIQEEKYDALGPEDQRMVDEMLGSRSAEVNRDQMTTRKRGELSAAPRHLPPLEDFRGLIEGALEIALVGSSKRLKGIKVAYDADVQGLAQLLPGVFHMPHLKAIGERASFLPTIATALARMANAESPSLRRKATDFQYGLPQLDMYTAPSEKVTQGIEGVTWRTLLNNVKPPTLRSRNSARAVQQPSTPVSNTRESLREPTTVIGDMFASPGSSSSNVQLRTPAKKIKSEPTLSLGTPLSTSEAFAQVVTNSTPTLFQGTLALAGPSPSPGPVSTPTLQIFGSPSLSQTHSNQISFGASEPHQTSMMNVPFQQTMPIVTDNHQYYPLASQNHNYYSTGWEGQDIYSMRSQDLNFGMEASRQHMSQGNPANFASFEDFLGDVSITNLSFEV